MRVRLAAVLLGSLFLLNACAGVTCGCVTPVTVLGAASLAAALEDLTADFRAEYPVATHFTVSTGSSALLRTQIEEGGPADVFMSADVTNPQALADKGLVDGPVQMLASTQLTIVVPAGNPGAIRSPVDLGRADVRVIAAGQDVPITKYAEQLVNNLGAVPGYPSDLAAAYESNIVSREDNVGAVVSKIALGEGDAAIVYVTDAQGPDVETIPIPAQANVTATYAGVVLKDASGPKAAHAFLDWVVGPKGQQILAHHGFSPAP